MATVDFSTFKYKIEIQNQTVEIDEYGIPQQVWKTVRKTRASVKTNSNSKSEKILEKFLRMALFINKELFF